MSTLNDIVGSNLRNLRKLKNLSQEKLAESAGISTDMLGRIERSAATPSFATLEALATALDVQPEALFGALGQSDQTGARAEALKQIFSDLARSNDDQVFLIKRVIGAVLDRKA